MPIKKKKKKVRVARGFLPALYTCYNFIVDNMVLSGPDPHGRFLLMKVDTALEISPSAVNMNINLSQFPSSLKCLHNFEISSYKQFLWISYFLQMARKWYSSSTGLCEHDVHIRWFTG